MVPILVTLNDLERRNGSYFALFTKFDNGPYFALFRRICVRCRRKTIVRLTSVSNLLLIVYDHINTICAIIQQLFRQNKF